MGKTPAAAPKSNRSQTSNTNNDLNELKDYNERLVKERNILA